MPKSSIEWTHSTWNPVTGCNKISQGCKFCYAERMAKRLHGMGLEKYRNGFEVTLHPEVVELPIYWPEPQTIFVNSMSDLFHEKVPRDYILDIFITMAVADWHTYQVLTKRSARLAGLSKFLEWPENVWMGVSVENEDVLFRIDDLRASDAKVKFLSCEPLIGPLRNMNLEGIDWVIVGGESGPGARYISPDWVRDIRDQCQRAGVAFFFKQWGGVVKSRTGRTLDNRTWDDMPTQLNVLQEA
ncbi:MAG: phage Gp37/Gp68 family protein [Calditrichaeota bacterium]|nr:phage Gp37/Gp68 family protein [Calditrichota bacterium]MCB9369378.1 phage Gp37/Gp68 family protein [Calditrichota bacterium]